MPIVLRSRGGKAWYRGIASPEIGINVSQFTVRWFPERDEKFLDATGQTFLRVVSAGFSREINVEGEMTTPFTGLMSFTIAVVCNFTNTAPGIFQPSPGSIYLDEASVVETRNGWVTVKFKCSSMARL